MKYMLFDFVNDGYNM